MVMMTVLGIQQPRKVQDPRVKLDLGPEQSAQPFLHRRADQLSVMVSADEINPHSGCERSRQGRDYTGMCCYYTIKLDYCLFIVAGKHAGARSSHRDPQEVEGVAEED